jgi:hypothetical protein
MASSGRYYYLVTGRPEVIADRQSASGKLSMLSRGNSHERTSGFSLVRKTSLRRPPQLIESNRLEFRRSGVQQTDDYGTESGSLLPQLEMEKAFCRSD